MKRWLILLGVGAVTALGLWLWSRNGIAVFVDAFAAFCA